MIQHVDISHFHAPYKNWPVAFGAEGATVSIVVIKDGVRFISPEAAPAIMEMLKAYATVFLTEDQARLDPLVPNDPRPSAYEWAQGKLKQGKSIVIGSTGGIETIGSPAAGAVLTLDAVKGSDGEKAAAGEHTFAFTAVLAQPGMLAKAGSSGLLLVGIGVAAIAVAAAVLGKKKRHATPNRRRRHRRRRY